jgi:NDP-sugar pyrophosphorylase family protein
VAGRPLIAHVLDSVAEAAPSEVIIIINEGSLAVRDEVASHTWPFAIHWIVETTPSSMHSFLKVVETLGDNSDGPFLVSTVDTIAPPGVYGTFVDAAANSHKHADVTLAVTDVTDDDKPLLVRAADDGRVIALGDQVKREKAAPVCATAGYYLVRSPVLREADSARRDGLEALRAFLGRLLDRGYTLEAVRVAGSVDVDRWQDVRAAETLLRQVDA